MLAKLSPDVQEESMKKKTLKIIPEFKTEEKESEFWARADSTEYVDWSRAEKGAFPNLKLSSKTTPPRKANESACK